MRRIFVRAVTMKFAGLVQGGGAISVSVGNGSGDSDEDIDVRIKADAPALWPESRCRRGRRLDHRTPARELKSPSK